MVGCVAVGKVLFTIKNGVKLHILERHSHVEFDGSASRPLSRVRFAKKYFMIHIIASAFFSHELISLPERVRKAHPDFPA